MSIPRSILSKRAHVVRVQTLYRRMLKQQMHFAVHRSVFYEMADQTRASFEKYRNATDPGIINAALRRAEQWLEQHQHPDPYRLPDTEGGSKFQRNAPPRQQILTRSMESFEG
eukprot:TRINITY_DN66249_c6_g1_i1.p1 TRINITY_DN66249_c6_g1~~TRINITY_DN66249_c6_g1_i1.p1  ORF type:complete len:122 (+),score=49.09 TRINITY_DN66249_c6_g1_i1:28-366(+)